MSTSKSIKATLGDDIQPRIRLEDLRFWTVWTLLGLMFFGVILGFAWLLVECIEYNNNTSQTNVTKYVYNDEENCLENNKTYIILDQSGLYYALSLILTLGFLIYSQRIVRLFLISRAQHRIWEQIVVFGLVTASWLPTIS